MGQFVIDGGKTLSGTIETNAGKNAPYALLFASLVVRGKVTLKEMTHVDEVLRAIELLSSIGVRFEWKDETTLFIDSSGVLTMDTMDKALCEQLRLSLCFFGALAGRETSYRVYKSGGCKLGNRTIRPHTIALSQLGIIVDSCEEYYDVHCDGLKAGHVVMYESGDTATENVIMAAVLAPGITTIRFASANYMVQDVCYFLQSAGADIEGIGTTTLTIRGVSALHDVEEYVISPDPVDAMAWISLAVTTKSPLTIANCALDFLELELQKLFIMGQKFNILNKRKSRNGKLDVVDVEIIPSDLTALPDKLYGRPYPGLNIDNVPLFVPILTQADGETMVHDWCYENRAIYYLELQKLGAHVLLLDTHRALVRGVTSLQANTITAPPALRPAMAILIAMLGATGISTLKNSEVIERGYDHIIDRLTAVGASISRGER